MDIWVTALDILVMIYKCVMVMDVGRRSPYTNDTPIVHKVRMSNVINNFYTI